MHLSIAAIFTYCVQIVESGLVSALEPCSWVDVVCKCRVTRQLVVGQAQVKAGFAKDSAVSSRPTFFLALCRK